MDALPTGISTPGPVYVGPRSVCREARISMICAAGSVGMFALFAFAITSSAVWQAIALLGLGCAFFLASFASGLGHSARRIVTRFPDRYRGDVLAFAALCIGWGVMSMIFTLIVLGALRRNVPGFPY